MVQKPIVSYAQNGEDILLWRALKHVQRGFYIDVGAQDPIVDSVTKAFSERGWHGINIEPVTQWYDRLVQDRPHDINLRLAVSNQPGSVKLFEVEASGLSTSDPEFARRHEANGHALHEHVVECSTLDHICADNEVGTVHFLKIDCEGAEKSALEGISLFAVRPWIILVEATEPNSTKQNWQDWEHLLTRRGYRFVFFDGLNRFYLADEHLELAPAFDAPVNVFDTIDGVRRIGEINAQELIERLRGEVEGLRGAATIAKLQEELGAIKAECNSAVAAREAALAERDAVMADRDAVVTARHVVAIERDRVIGERKALAIERDALIAERNDLRVRHSTLQQEDAERRRELWRLQASLAELLASRSWRITSPLRTSARFARWVFRRSRSAAFYSLRPFAHMARPLMRRVVEWSPARKLVVGIFGRHSRLVNTGRLFLIGSPVPPPEVEHKSLPETASEENSLSARGREVLSTLEEMRTKAKGEPQRASRT